MKKKLLSLVLAGAMVASTSVSAFAEGRLQGADTESQVTDTTSQVTESVANGIINGTDEKNYTTNVRIEGSVANDDGKVNPGTLSVTVATAANFTVDKEGKFLASNISINNSGTQDVDVYAYGFKDTNPGTGITVKKKSELTGQKRDSVSLKVSGELGTAHLNSNPGSKGNGIYSDEEQTSPVSEWKLATVTKSSSKDLVLSGEAGTNKTGITDPVNDTFTLVLKIKKSDGK